MRTRWLLLGGGALAWLLSVDCKSRPSSELVVGVSTQMKRDLHAMRVVVRSQGGTLACRTIDLDREHVAVEVVRASGPSNEPVTVTAVGYAQSAASLGKDDCATEGTPKIIRRHRTRLVDGESLYLGVPLRRICLDVACGDGETCIAGECASDLVDPATLVTYADTLVRGDTSFCFSPARCFEDVVPALLSKESDCTFQLPDEAKLDDHMNIEALHDDLSREILDHEPTEGFTRIDESHFRIAPGLCRRYLSRQISAIYVGANCNPKSPLSPLCSKKDEEHDAGPAERSLCTKDATLLPTRAAFFLLLDRSVPMAGFFGESNFREALDLVLRWPLLRRSLVGLQYLPANPNVCTDVSNPFATPVVPLGPIEQVRPLVHASLGDVSNLPPDGPLYLDAALRDNGCYAALGAVSVADFPQRHLVLLGNRDFGPHCSPTIGAAPDLAFAAYTNRKLYTSAMILKVPPGTDTGRDVYGDAVLITRSGHGGFFDGSPDDAAMRLGILTMFTSQASCLYDLPESIAPAADRAQTKLSYFNLLTSLRTDIDHNGACSETNGADGWNLEGRRVRVCGKPCTDLRFMLGFSAQYAVERHLAPVDVPMKWSAPCP